MAARLCLDCEGITDGGTRCEPCRLARGRRRDQRRGSTTARGLGWKHQQQRRRLIDKAGPITNCPRCGREITEDNPITGEHGVPRAHGGSDITELICRSCNSSLGGSIRRHRR